MFPIVAKFGSFTLHTFGVMLATAILVGSWWGMRETRRLGDPKITEERMQRLIWYIVIAVIAGGRFMHVMVEHRYYSEHPLSAFAVWEGGLVMYGGMLAVFFTVIAYAAKNHINILRLCDLVAPAAFLGGAIGRWGCFFAGDDYGKPTNSWVGVRFTDENSLVPHELRGVALHPAQIYMSLKCLIIFIVLTWITRRKKFDGQVVGSALLLYSVLRIIVEQFRGDADRGFVGPVSSAQFTSIFVFFVALGVYWFSPRRTIADDKPAKA